MASRRSSAPIFGPILASFSIVKGLSGNRAQPCTDHVADRCPSPVVNSVADKNVALVAVCVDLCPGDAGARKRGTDIADRLQALRTLQRARCRRENRYRSRIPLRTSEITPARITAPETTYQSFPYLHELETGLLRRSAWINAPSDVLAEIDCSCRTGRSKL